jgi:hypothetical protein
VKHIIANLLMLLTIVTGVANATLICCELSTPVENSDKPMTVMDHTEEMPCHSEMGAQEEPQHEAHEEHTSCDCPECSQFSVLKVPSTSPKVLNTEKLALATAQLPFAPIYGIYQPPRQNS